MKKIPIVFLLGLALSLTAVQAQALELGAGASFNTVAMDHLNELIATYNARAETNIPHLKSGLGLSGSLMIELPLLDLGLGVERIAASTSAIDLHGDLVRVNASAFGFLGIGSLTILRGGLGALISAAFGWYSASYFSDLDGIRAEGSAAGYKLGVIMGLKLTRNLSLDGVFNFRSLALNELTDGRGNTLTTPGRPYLDFSGFELGLGVGWSF